MYIETAYIFYIHSQRKMNVHVVYIKKVQITRKAHPRKFSIAKK